MTKMSRKARLQADEERPLSRYLGAFRTEESNQRSFARVLLLPDEQQMRGTTG